MFTGIIEEVGIIKEVKRGVKSSKLIIKANKVLEKTRVGDSICTNGVCLTVTNVKGNSFEADVMAETLRRSNLGLLDIGNKVNLERALNLESRLGGHIVSGHIDGIGQIISLEKEDNAIWVTVKAASEILRYVVLKGSITIDGVSLTVAYVDKKILKVSIIPHTKESTTLLGKKVGDLVNLESDIIGKYVKRFTSLSNEDDKNKNKIYI